ncbi:Homeobox-like domain-containing protein [Dioscorea alata]|uniref:Homeobox-like domain-containing protein n=1 Tax=Dioscorea alata TaxID=55571 RepID=A0ACB7UZ71_DIOAL|nr:Homeobox-like domain-containing protein [Dioscorea alata]
MENLTSQASVKTNKRNNHQWTPAEDKILIECCLELVNQGWRADNGFKTGYLSQEMRSQSGFVWDEANKCVTCEDDSHKEAAGLRNKQFPYFDELAIIFGKEQATGDGAEFTSEYVEALERENPTLAAAKSSFEAHEAMKNMVEDDYFGVDIELENECSFISENACDESSNASCKRSKAQEKMQGESSVPPKKQKKKGSTKDPTDDSFSKHIERFYDICDGAKQEIGKVVTYFQHLNANT